MRIFGKFVFGQKTVLLYFRTSEAMVPKIKIKSTCVKLSNHIFSIIFSNRYCT